MLGSHVLSDGKVRFHYHDYSAHEISVAGNFSDWKPVSLAAQEDGWWGADLGPLPAGNVYYKFVTPHGWRNDQFNYRKTSDGENSFLNVGGQCGHVLRRGFYSPSLGNGKNYCIYLPPAYAQQEWRSFPVLTLMGGLFENETGWVDRARVEETLDRLILAGEIDDMIVIMPEKDDAVFHQNAWSAYFGYLAQDLPNHVEGEYHTLPVRAAEGLSLGAGWAIRLGLSLPERYCSVSGLSGQYSGDFYEAARNNLEHIQSSGTRFRIACGDGEGNVVDDNASFSTYLEELDIHCEFHVNSGPHDWPLWIGQIPNSLKFHDYGFKQRIR